MKGTKTKNLLLLYCVILSVMLCPMQMQAKSKVKLNKTKISMYIGDTIKLKVSGETKKITWSSSDVRVVSVNENGKVTGKRVGKATIKGKVAGKTLSCTVNVKNVLNVDKTSLTIQENGRIKVALKKSGTVSWEVDDSSIISCEWGNDWIDDTTELHVAALKKGIAYITIANTYNNEEVIVKVIVDKDTSNSDSYTSEENSSDSLEKKIDIKLTFPHNGANNKYVEIEYVNHSGYDIELNGYTFNNGYRCLLNCEGEPYTLKDGYKIKLTYFRSPIWSNRFDDRYNDMYLDNNSTGWTMIKINGESIKFTYDRNGTIKVGY